MAEDMEQALEILRRGYDAFNRGDFDAAVSFMDPEIEWDRVADFEKPLRGREAVRDFMAPEVFSSQRSDVREIHVVGDCLIADVDFHSVAAGSGIELTQRGFHLWRIRDGLATEFRYFVDRDDAVQAAESGT